MSGAVVRGLRRKPKSPFMSLLGMQMKLAYGAKGMAEKLGLGRRARNAYLYFALIAVGFAPLATMLYGTAKVIAAQAVALGQPGLPVVTAVTAGQFLVFFLGVSAVMSVLYYADDTETLLGLPLTARQIMLAKMLVAYVTEIFIGLAITGPFLVALGRQMATPDYWLSALLVEAAIPAIPLALSLLATVGIMRVTKGSRKRDQFRVVLGLLFFIVILGVQYLNTAMIQKGPDEVMRLLMERNGLLQVVSGYYPPLKWAAWALTGETFASRLGGLALFVGVSFALLGVVSTISQKWFLSGYSKDVATAGASRGIRRGFAGGKETGSRASVGAAVKLRQRSPSMAVAMRDHYMLVRTPNFLLVTLTNLTVFPLVLVFSTISGQGAIPYITGGATGRVLDIMTLILVGIHGLIVAMNQVSSTSITREGRAFWASKMIPVSPSEQVKGKLGYGLVVATLQLAVFVATSALLLKVDAPHLGVIAALGALVSLPVTSICIMNDLYNPKMNWDDPHQAMKGNFGTIVAMLFSAIYLAIVGFIVKFMLSAGVSVATIYSVAAVILAASGVVLAKAAFGFADKRYSEIEV